MTAHQYPSFPILQRKNNATSVGAWMSASRMRNCEQLMDSARLKTRVRLKTPRARTGRTTQRLTPRNERGLVTNHSPLREALRVRNQSANAWVKQRAPRLGLRR